MGCTNRPGHPLTHAWMRARTPGPAGDRRCKDRPSPDPVRDIAPQKAPDYCAYTGGQHQERGLVIGEPPRFDDKAQNEPEHEEIEELEHVRQDRSYQYAVLASRHR